jgi:hypothetical protein
MRFFGGADGMVSRLLKKTEERQLNSIPRLAVAENFFQVQTLRGSNSNSSGKKLMWITVFGTVLTAAPRFTLNATG